MEKSDSGQSKASGLLTMAQAAERLGVAEAAVARRLLNTAGITQRIGERLLVVSSSDLDAFIAARGSVTVGRPRKVATSS